MANWATKPATMLGYGVIIGGIVIGGIWYSQWFKQKQQDVIAKVGSTTITKPQLYSQLEASSGLTAVNQMVTNQLIEDGAKKYNITASTSDINNAISSIEASNGISSDAELQQALAQSGMTLDKFKTQIRIDVLEQKLTERTVNVTDAQIQSYYNQNKSQFTKSGKVQPLSAVKTQIVSQIKQTKAISPTVLMQNLVKDDPITIVDPTYATVKTNILNPSTTTPAS